MKQTFWLCIILIACSFLSYCYMSCGKASGSEPRQDENIAALSYAHSQEIITNPERGFMHLYTVRSEGEPLSMTTMKNLKKENVSLVHRNYYFEKFKDKALSQAELDLIQTDFNIVREAGLKLVLCFAYTGIDYVWWNGEEDAPLATIEMHLDQLKPLFEKNKDVIAFVQAGFVGPWGEWHSSANKLTTPDNMKKVMGKMMACIPSEIMIQVRTPLIKQTIFDSKVAIESNMAWSGEGRARVGHYNHCFLSGPTDYDTYVDIVAEKNYISADAQYVPTGGETCPPQAGTPGCELAIAEMTKLKWTYLNLDWYVPTLNAWRTSGCFDEFQRKLGYRLALSDAELPKEAAAGKQASIKIEIANHGYAPVYNLKKTKLVLKEPGSGKSYQLPLAADIRSCKPGGKIAINETIDLKGIDAGTYELYLNIGDRADNLAGRSEYCIRLANTHIKAPFDGLNSLSHQLKIINQ
jgi:hypothetical protein